MALSHSPQIVRSGLILYLDVANQKSYPGSGITWFDLSGNLNNGTLTNGPVYSTLNKGNFIFDGVNDYVSTISGSGLTTFTIGFWVKTTESRSNNTFWQRPSFFGKSNGGSNSGDFGITINSGYLGYWSGLSADSSYLSTIKIDDNIWRYVVCTNNGSSLNLFVNSILITGSSLNSGTPLNSQSFWVGAKGGSELPGSYCNCSISNLTFYNRTLTNTEINKNFEATRGRYGV